MSVLRHLYYDLKPFLPNRVRLGFRRALAGRIARGATEIWPIDPAAAEVPRQWPGWPEGKKFAVVLTHDVERQGGLDKVRELAELEKELGFRSSFNFIPEGPYDTPAELREELGEQGFEVGIHDLKHDGKLYRTKSGFNSHAERINGYLTKWGAVGFRSGFMHHNLDWLHGLKLEYDSSTFDTDPFEPQPEPHGTIFPFWVQHETSKRKYVELPYTLPQDSTLFLILREKTIDIWKNKLDWVAQHGGMVLMNTHPDYMAFGERERDGLSFPARFYTEFLRYLKEKHAGQYWSCLPRDVARYMRERGEHLTPRRSGLKRKIWVDLDNTPHVPFFKPIIEELEARGHSVAVTSRQAFQVCDLATEMGLRHTTIGRHYGKKSIAKISGLFIRALQFIPFVLREKPDLAVSHGARSQILICNLLRIPTILLADYEHAKILPFLRPTWLYVPEVIPTNLLADNAKVIKQYPGIKEDVYVPRFRPTGKLKKELDLDDGKITVTMRPPANEAHYRSPASDALFEAAMNHLTSRNDIQIVLLPRNQNQLEEIRNSRPQWFENRRTVVPQKAVDGLELIAQSDLVFSGGGTMNREAAALHVPVYSIFRGKIGAVDKYLAETGRLVLLETPLDVQTKVTLVRRNRNGDGKETVDRTLPFLVNEIETLAGG